MTEYTFTAEDLETLKAWDTPTICNGLEIVSPERRAKGFTVEPVVVVDPKLPPIVGLARTGIIRAKEPPRGPIPPREDWYDYVAGVGMPTIAVIQDVDDSPGFGAFWGEVQTTVHAALGVAGCVTNGSFRDIDVLAPGFQIVGGFGSGQAFMRSGAYAADEVRREAFSGCLRATTTSSTPTRMARS